MALRRSRDVLLSETLLMERILSERLVDQKYLTRIQIVLGRLKGMQCTSLAYLLSVHPMTISRVFKKYREEGVYALISDLPRPPGKVPISPSIKRAVVEYAIRASKRAPISSRSLARIFGISHMSVDAILYEYGHYSDTVTPEPLPRSDDVIGAYCIPPFNLFFFIKKNNNSSADSILYIPDTHTCNEQDIPYRSTPGYAAFLLASRASQSICYAEAVKKASSFIRSILASAPRGSIVHGLCERNQAFMLARRNWMDILGDNRFKEHIISTRQRWIKVVGDELSRLWITGGNKEGRSSLNSMNEAFLQSFSSKGKRSEGVAWMLFRLI